MKKITFLVLCVLFIYPHNTSSQFLTGFGVKGGLTFSNQRQDFRFNIKIDNSFIPGFNGSVFGEFLDNKTFNLFAEAGYDRRGYILNVIRTDEFGNKIGEYEVKNSTNYIFTSLGTKLKFPSKYVAPYILLAPRLDFYLGYNVTSSEYSEFWTENTLLEEFKKVMFDFSFGAGIQFNRLLPYRTFIEANYNPGIITSFSNSNLDVWEHSFNIKIGINFIKDKKK